MSSQSGPNSRQDDAAMLDLEPLPRLPPGDGVCNARKVRTRGYCTSKIVLENGRCRIHGGKTPKSVSLIARTSKSEYLPEQIYARFESLNGTAIDNLEESIKIQQSLETSIIERLNTGESAIAWASVKEILSGFSLVDDGIPENISDHDKLVMRVDRLEKLFHSLRDTVVKGSRSFAVQSQLRKELVNAHEAQSKLTETLTKSRKEVQQTYTEEQWNTLLLAILASLKRHVEVQMLTAVVKDFESFSAEKLLKAA